MNLLRTLTALLALGASTTALAHTGHDVQGLASGLAHPLLGLDHLAAMLAVGLWASRQRGAPAWRPLAVFLVAMAGGALLGWGGVALPGLETGIALSVLVLGGLLLAGGTRAGGLLPLIGLFALYHGQAHGLELPLSAHPGAYALGFLLTTAALQLTGLALGRLALRHRGQGWLRLAGAAAGGLGAWLLLGA